MDASHRLQNWENEQRIDTIASSKRLEFPQFQQHELERPFVQQALLDSQRGGGDNNPGPTQQENV